MSGSIERRFFEVPRKNPHLKEFRYYLSIKRGLAKHELRSLENEKFRISKLRRLELSFGLSSGWSLFNGEKDLDTELFLNGLAHCLYLAELKFRVFKYKFTLEDVLNLTEKLLCLPNLTHFSMEFLNCRVGDLETVSLVYGLSKLCHLKSLHFKIINQHLLSEQATLHIIGVLIRIRNLENINFFLSRKSLSQEIIQNIIRLLKERSDITYSFTKKCISLSK